MSVDENIPVPVVDIAQQLGLLDPEVELYGKHMAKVDYSRVLSRLADRPQGKFIVVTGMTPTPLGEGKTVTSIAIGQAMTMLGMRVCNTLREPSKGPSFGFKGGGCGGGRCQMIPMENINLHFTGDIYAVEAAQNLCSSVIDSSILFGNPLDIDSRQITWPRCIDMSDRALREVVVGLGSKVNGYPRQDGYVITPATETAAIHSLATSLADLRDRLERTVIGFSRSNKPVTCGDLKVAGAMTALLIDALKPNLVQSTEHHPVFCHGFPFANIAHGNSSVLADMVGLKLCDYVISESGFGTDCGFEKLMNVKMKQSGINVDGAVIAVSVRALKHHGGAFHLRPGMSVADMKDVIEKEDLGAVERGGANLAAHVRNVRAFNVPVVVAINRFPGDTDRELDLARQMALEMGSDDAVVHDAWRRGGDGAIELANAVIKATDGASKNSPLYAEDASIKEKIETVATRIYGADGVDYSPLADGRIQLYSDLGYDNLCVNMVKTQFSLSHNPALLGAPCGWRLPVNDVRAPVGAGFLCPMTGNSLTMPGLPSRSSFPSIEVDVDSGKIQGLF